MERKHLHEVTTSQREICDLLGFSQSTVNGWRRKGFRLVGSAEGDEIETSRGRHNTLSGFNAIELGLTIHFYQHGIPVELAHTAAVRIAHTGHGSSGWVGCDPLNDLTRNPGETYRKSGVATFVAFTSPAYEEAQIRIIPADHETKLWGAISDVTGSILNHSVQFIEIDAFVGMLRERLGVDRHARAVERDAN
ncbi:MAG: hypothetical protein WBG08_04980 [Litorimonas sp.]